VSPAPGMPATNYSVRWTGQLLTVESGTYTLNLNHDDGARLWINNLMVLDQWGTTGVHNVTYTFAAGTKYDFKLEYKQATGAAKMALKWERVLNASGDPLSPWQIIPRGQFYPPDYGVPEVVLDNAGTTGVVKTGSWTTSVSVPVGQSYYATNFLHDSNAGKGTKSVTFTPTLPLTGPYEIFIRQPGHTDRATNVPVTITHASGTTSVVIDEKVNGSEWVSFGVYQFNAGSTGSVLISNAGTNGLVAVDAVKFVKR